MLQISLRATSWASPEHPQALQINPRASPKPPEATQQTVRPSPGVLPGFSWVPAGTPNSLRPSQMQVQECRWDQNVQFGECAYSPTNKAGPEVRSAPRATLSPTGAIHTCPRACQMNQENRPRVPAIAPQVPSQPQTIQNASANDMWFPERTRGTAWSPTRQPESFTCCSGPRKYNKNK